MEKGMSLRLQTMKQFDRGEADLRTYSPLSLAFLGDAVYSLLIRTLVLSEGNRPAGKLHRETSEYVCASAQAAIGDAILPLLTPEEERIYKRGRNANPSHHTRSATMEDYIKATALETLCGYLYLKDETERLLELLHEGIRIRSEAGQALINRDPAADNKADQ